MSKKSKKNITLEDLATMVQKGFQETATKAELSDFGKDVFEEFDRIHSDIRDIKATLGPLVRVTAHQEQQIQDLYMRVHRLERKAGLEK